MFMVSICMSLKFSIHLQKFRYTGFRKFQFQNSLFMLVGCRIKANCPFVGPKPVRGMPSMGVFIRDPSPYLPEFRRKPQKTSNGLVDKRDRGLNPAPPVYQLERKTAQPLMRASSFLKSTS